MILARQASASPGYGGQVAIRDGSWKVLQRDLAKGGGPVRAFDLASDPREGRSLELTGLPVEVRTCAAADLARLRLLAAPR